MKAGIVTLGDLLASKGVNMNANYWLDRTHDVDKEIARAEERKRQADARLAELNARRDAILAEAEPKVRRIE